jgi:hypothetical protein
MHNAEPKLDEGLEMMALAPGEVCATEQVCDCLPALAGIRKDCSWHESPTMLTLNLRLMTGS